MDHLPNLNDRVAIVRDDGFDDLIGHVVGFGAQQTALRYRMGHPEPIVLVELEHGFYSPDGGSSVLVLPVHPDNLVRLA